MSPTKQARGKNTGIGDYRNISNEEYTYVGPYEIRFNLFQILFFPF